MLKALTVKNFALVEFLDINFESGLTVITGESGAGKSILLGALGLVLGDRASTTSIRPGCDKADVSAEFHLKDNEAALSYLQEHDLTDDDSTLCLIRRVVSRDGRSRAFINGTPVRVNSLAEFASGLVDIQGQHEPQHIARRDVQLGLLDDFGTPPPLLADVAKKHEHFQTLAHELETLRADIEAQRDREDLLAYQVGELDNLSLEANEVASLEATQKRLTQAQYIQATVMATLEQIEASDALASSRQKLTDIDDPHPTLAAALGMMETAITNLEESRRELDDYLQSLDSEQASLAEVSSRLDSIYDLARKHRVHADELVNHHQLLSEELDRITHSEENLEALTGQRDTAHKVFIKVGKKLSSARRASADEFAGGISRYMQSLGITAGALSLNFRDEENAKGLESVEYLIVTNPNYPAAPLAKVASGGERTRISLAVQVVAAEKSNLPCLVLDEADVGVGGTTADVVGRLLRGLGQHTQVICVTHAPQVAALGDHHLCVGKSQDHDTLITPLSEEGRITELSRMLAGADVTDKTRNYAQTLLSEAGSEVH